MENFLQEIYRRLRSNQVGIFIDGEDLPKSILSALPTLRERLKEIGEIRFAQVMYQSNIDENEFKVLRQTGFSDKIFPGNLELSLILEAYDVVLDKKIDFIIIGSTSDEMISLFTELRKTVTVFAFVDDIKRVSKAFQESVDGIITQDTVADFVFNSKSLYEFDQFISSTNGDTGTDSPDHDQYVGDEANIGTFSEEIVEDDLIEEMKKEKEN